MIWHILGTDFSTQGLKKKGFCLEIIWRKFKSFNVNSVSLLSPTTNFDEEQIPHVWKVFSQKPLTDQNLNEIFVERKELKVCDWLAYPSYETNQTLSNFVISDNLYHINAIEWSASAMEMSVIGAKNVANLISEKFNNIDEDLKHSNDEL